MVESKRSYEECRKQRLEENKKRMEELNIGKLALALKASSTPKSSPVSFLTLLLSLSLSLSLVFTFLSVWTGKAGEAAKSITWRLFCPGPKIESNCQQAPSQLQGSQFSRHFAFT